MIIIGIDPGQSGGIAAFGSAGYETENMPKTPCDLYHLLRKYRDLAENEPIVAFLEEVHTMPDQGISSSGKFMKGYGIIIGILTALEIPIYDIRPQKWQKTLEIPPRRKKPTLETKTEFKNRLKQKAQQLFPGAGITLHTADALLIAEYGRRQIMQQQTPQPQPDLWDDL